MKLLIIILIASFLFSTLISCADQNEVVIKVSNLPEDSTVAIPIEIQGLSSTFIDKSLLATSISDPEVSFILQKTHSSKSSEFTYSAIIPAEAMNGEYRITPSKAKPIFEIVESDDGKLSITEEGQGVLIYNFGMQLPEGVPERYRRSTYVHPVYDLEGNMLTDDFPEDHYHHRGLSWMWPKVFIDSVRYDLWHIYGQNQESDGIHQIFENWIVKDDGPVCAEIEAKNYWQLENGIKVMDEWISLKVYKGMESVRVIDIALKFKAKVKIGIEGQDKKGYGGLNFRFAPRRETIITSNQGIEEDSDLKKIPWADQSAKFGSNEYFSGASIFQKERNNDFPAGWCLRHYGFLGVAWPGIDRIYLEPDEEITLEFRILVHQGTSEEAMVKQHYKVFSESPIISVN